MDPPNLVETLNDTEGSIVWGLYFHLWKKTHKGLPCPDINLPHTVLYQDSRPIAWYFTSVKENKIYRKKKGNMSGQAMWEAFNSGKDPGVDVCAWFSGNMTRLSSSPKKVKGKEVDDMYLLSPEQDDKEAASFEYLVHERVQHLTAPGQYTVVTEQVYDGLLQKFVLPREAADSVLRVIWSPTACVCERRVNRNPLVDARAELPDRIASFDQGKFWLNVHQPLPAGSVLVQRLSSQCDTIVRHLRETTSGKVSVARMEVFFKVDAHNRVWLLYCNSLRLDRTVLAVDRAPSASLARQYTMRDPTRHDEDTRIPVDDTPFMCAMTGEMCEGRQRCDVTYKLLIQAWFAEAAQLASEADRIAAMDNIPPSIRRANPNISRDYYLRMRSQPMFLLKTAPVCAAAAAELSAATLQDLARTISRPTNALAQSAGRVSASGNHHALTATSGSKAAGPPAGKSAGLLLQQNRNHSKHSAAVAAAIAEVEGGILYQPGATIPAALMPKPTLKGTLSKSGPVPTGTGELPPVKPASNGSPSATGTRPEGGAGKAGVSSPARPAAGEPVISKPSPGGARRPPPVSVASPSASGRSPASARGSQSPTRARNARAPQPGGAPGAQGGGSPGRPQPSGAPYVDKNPAAARAGLRSPDRPSHVSSDDLRTLKELNAAYASAEAKTAELLAQAHQVLNEPPAAATRRMSSELSPPAGDKLPALPGSKRASSAGRGSRPLSAAHKAGSRPPSGSKPPPAGVLAPKPGGAAAGLTSDEAALLSEALAEA